MSIQKGKKNEWTYVFENKSSLLIFAEIEIIFDILNAEGWLFFKPTPIGSRVFQIRCRCEILNSSPKRVTVFDHASSTTGTAPKLIRFCIGCPLSFSCLSVAIETQSVQICVLF